MILTPGLGGPLLPIPVGPVTRGVFQPATGNVFSKGSTMSADRALQELSDQVALIGGKRKLPYEGKELLMGAT